MKKSEIIDAVAELVQDNSGAMRALIGRWVNVVLDDIASRGLLTSLQREERTGMVAGIRDYELASDTDQIFKVFVPAWGDPEGRLAKLNSDQFLKKLLEDGADTQGRPLYYTLFGNRTLRLHPIPDSTNAPTSPTDNQKLYLWKYKDIAHLTENDDITEIKIKHTPTLIAGAYAFGARFDSLGDLQDANEKYEAGIGRIIADSRMELDRPYQTPYQDI